MNAPTEQQRRAAVERTRRWVASHPERARAHRADHRARVGPRALKDVQLRAKFGISIEQYEEMHARQDGVCLLCKRPERVAGRDLAVDHCHETGRVRGLLCGHCNRALGFFNHDWRALLRAAWYLWPKK